MSKKIIVVGAGGQLANCISDIANKDDNFIFLTHKDLDIADKDSVYKVIIKERPDVVINCAAYTNTTASEKNIKAAYEANSLGPMYLAHACKTADAKLIHISTDYVFDGKSNSPYKETDECHPINMYGLTKYFGEVGVLKENPSSIIIRTSWLYSWYGANFMTKMMSKINEGKEFGVVYDVIGCPTYAGDLADFILQAISTGKYKELSGVYHYSNNGIASRYDFAMEIERIYRGENRYVKPCLSTMFGETIDYPMYAVLDKTKTEDLIYGYIPDWRVSLGKCIESRREKGDD